MGRASIRSMAAMASAVVSNLTPESNLQTLHRLQAENDWLRSFSSNLVAHLACMQNIFRHEAEVTRGLQTGREEASVSTGDGAMIARIAEGAALVSTGETVEGQASISMGRSGGDAKNVERAAAIGTADSALSTRCTKRQASGSMVGNVEFARSAQASRIDILVSLLEESIS